MSKVARLLVVVDMQKRYPAASDPSLVKRINEGVKRRLSAGQPVVYLTMHLREDEGLTIACPEGVIRLWKSDDDGSDSISGYIAGLRECPESVEVWGVNTTCCVLRTAIGLAVDFEREGRSSVPVEVNLRYCGDGSTARGVRFRCSP